MMPKARKEAPTPHQSQSKNTEGQETGARRCPEPKKKKRFACHPPSHDQDTASLKPAQIILERAPPRETSLTTMPSSSSTMITESARKKIEDKNTLVFLVDVKANKHEIKQVMKKLYDVDVTKVNTLISPKRKKEAYVQHATA
ncbi:60S ribosomal protein L23a-like [Neovison vison]|uniref:60S ribosomal protein L23a-like n=1 Tax=Neovison vison TaxID=452646 RepID=UPI001CF002A0|nr:60S ribosomal protein L23a-like [Neogale vison]